METDSYVFVAECFLAEQKFGLETRFRFHEQRAVTQSFGFERHVWTANGFDLLGWTPDVYFSEADLWVDGLDYHVRSKSVKMLLSE